MMPVRRMQHGLPGIFSDIFGREWVDKSNVTAPAVNILETEQCFRIEVAAPGMTRQDFKVHIKCDNELVIAMERCAEPKKRGEKGEKCDKEPCEEKATYLRREFSYSCFRQSLILPENIDAGAISATMEHGVLTICIPKKNTSHEAPASRQIEIG